MTQIYDLQQRADVLRKKTATDSISPEEVGGLHADTLAYIANMERYASSLGIKKVYTSVSEMNGDVSPVSSTGMPLKAGQLVTIFNAEAPDAENSGEIYAFQNPGWVLVGRLDAGTADTLKKLIKGDKTTVTNNNRNAFVWLGNFETWAEAQGEIDKLHAIGEDNTKVGEFRLLLNGRNLIVRNYVQNWATGVFTQTVQGSIQWNAETQTMDQSMNIKTYERRYNEGTGWTTWEEGTAKIEIAQELSTEEGSENKTISQKTVSEEFFKLLGTSDVVLCENKELGVREKVTLPTNLKDDDVVQIELLTEGLTSNILWSNRFSNNNGALKVHFPRTFLYKFIKDFQFDFQGAEKISVKVTIIKRVGLISNENTLLYRGAYSNNFTIADYGLKPGDQLLIKNSKTEFTGNGVLVYVYKNTLGGDYIRAVFAGYESIITVTDDMTKLFILFARGGDVTSELEVWKVSEYNKNYNQMFYKQLCDYDFITCGDSITAWSAGTDTGSEDIAKFNGWAYLLAGHVGFKSFKNISVSGASYTQSSIYGSYAFSINRTIKNNLPEGFSGVFVLTGGTNDYDGKKSLGSCEETMAKTYEELDETNNTDNFSSICDGFRYCLETAIRKCSWKARIFVITCVPRNDKGDYTMAQMNEQLKLIAKAFNVPVIDMFSEISFRNGLDHVGQTWKLSEVTEEGGTENVHPNADAQQIMAQFVYSKLLTYIR